MEALKCNVCPRQCELKEGQRGFCNVRINTGGSIVSTTYGRNTGLAIDPIEKKPLAHFYPGSTALSLGTAGCNLGCLFCQNWNLSRSREGDLKSISVSPEQIAQIAAKNACRSVAYTYNDPVVWYEYAADTAKACREWGIKNVAVTAGYILPQARKILFERMDAANVDLRGIRPDFYRNYSHVEIQPVLDTLKYLRNETNVWLEVTNLLIPPSAEKEISNAKLALGNDSESDIQSWCDWVLENLGDQTPVHFSAFHPSYKITDRAATPTNSLLRAWRIACAAGLKYVYLGNVRAPEYEATYCPKCGQCVIGRDGYKITQRHLVSSEENPDGEKNRCLFCGEKIAGRF